MRQQLLAYSTAWHLLGVSIPLAVLSLLSITNHFVAAPILGIVGASRPGASGDTTPVLAPSAAVRTMSLPGVLSPKHGPRSVLSPSKQALCSPTRQPFGACNAQRLAPACASHAKRCLSSYAQQQNSSNSGPAAASTVRCCCGPADDGSSPAYKRYEHDVLPPASGAAAATVSTPQPVGPLTPAAEQPLVTCHLSGSSNQSHHSLVCPHSSGLAAAGPVHAAPSSLLGSGQQHYHLSSSSSPSAMTVDTVTHLDQVPPPMVILDSPPKLERVVQPGLQQQVVGERQYKTLMSGVRVAASYDVPLTVECLKDAPEYCPKVGDGRLELIMGPMFAGKSTALINRIKQVVSDDQRVVVVKSSQDKRYSNHWVVTHMGNCTRCYIADTLSDFKRWMGRSYHKFKFLAIDEAQFFPDLHEFCCEAVDVYGKHVIVAGLSGDFKRQRFGHMTDLMPMADSITQLRSKCAFCERDALFSLRLVGMGGPQALVGGDDKYRATCRRCYLQHSAAMQ